MGRRSINTTKSGKYMNPTDQARKEARKKELKKNKKQRQMVRAAVLKGKDPQQLIVDLEKIDQMEFNVLQPSPLNEKVLKDKRKKLKDTLDRVLKLYAKDDPDKWGELKRAQVDYDRKRSAIVNLYESVKNAQDVQLEEIPLPINVLGPELQAVISALPSHIPLPPQMAIFRPPQGILKKSSAYSFAKTARKTPPGIPPGPPPDLEEFSIIPDAPDISNVDTTSAVAPQRRSIRFADTEEMEVDATPADEDQTQEKEEEEHDETEAGGVEASDKPTSLQQKLLAMSGQNVDEFLKEMGEVNKKRKAARAADLDARLSALENRAEDMDSGLDNIPPLMTGPPDMMGPGPPHLLPGLPGMMFRPPPRGMPPLMGIRLPPGPPPGLPPRLNMRMPPGPPPGLPPRLLPRLANMPMGPPPQMTNTLSAAPQLINRTDGSGTTIKAQAKIRNLSADVTRFVPSSLRHKREDSSKPKAKPAALREPRMEVHQPIVRPGQTKDDAYQQFMREMEGLM